jgi:hypothetical protein
MLGDGVGHDLVHIDADALWGLGGLHAEVNGIALATGARRFSYFKDSRFSDATLAS